MKIAINALSVVPHEMGGTEIFLVNLIRNLLKINTQDKFSLIVSRNNKFLFNHYSKNLNYIDCTFNNTSRIKRLLWEQLILPIQLKRANIDILVSPGNTGLIFAPCKTVIIIQSMLYFIYPETFPLAQRVYLQNFVKYSCNKADILISPSKNNKEDIIRYTKVPPSKVKIVYEGVDFSRFNPSVDHKKIERTLERHGIRGQYIFSPTSLYKYKNYDALLRAYSNLLRDTGIKQKLVICGLDPHKNKAELQELIMELGLQDDVYYLGYILPDEIVYFYKGASLTMYLSLYESFGLPVLEAMASGCPIICSNRSSLPEVVGDAGVLVDPLDVNEITARMYDLLTNEGLRAEYIKRGLSHAKQFSWKNTAKRLIEICNQETEG